VDVPAGLRRKEHQRRVVQEAELALRLRLERLAEAFGIGDEIQLVDAQDQRLAGLHRVAGDGGVGVGHALDGIEEQHGQVRLLQVLAGEDDAQFLRVQVGAALLADPRRVDESVAAAVGLELGVHRVAGGAGDLAHDDPFGADQRVHQRRFAHVGPADDGHPRLGERRVRGVRDGEVGAHRFEEGVQAALVLRRHRIDVVDAELVERQGVGLVARVVHLVGHQVERPARFHHQAVDHRVHGVHPRGGIDHHQHRRRLGQGHGRLLEDFAGDAFALVGQDAAGVHQAEPLAVPVHLAVEPVAGDARLVADDGAAGAHQRVEQGGLAHVGPADDHHHGECGSGHRHLVTGRCARGPCGRRRRP